MSERDEQPTVRRAERAINRWSTRVRSRALPIAYGSALLVLPVLWWFFDDPRSWVWVDLPGLLGLVLAPALGLHVLASWGRADLYLHPLGLRAEGAVLSTVIPEPRVEEILESTHSIVLQLRDLSDLLVFWTKVIDGLDDETRVPQAAATVESWLRRAVPGASTGLTTRPSPRLGPAAVLVIGVLGWIAVRLS